MEPPMFRHLQYLLFLSCSFLAISFLKLANVLDCLLCNLFAFSGLGENFWDYLCMILYLLNDRFSSLIYDTGIY